MSPPRIHAEGAACIAQPCDGTLRPKQGGFGLCSSCYQHGDYFFRTGSNCACEACRVVRVGRERRAKARVA